MGVNAMSTSITKQPFILVRILKHIINNRIRPVIVSILLIKLENMKIEMTLLLKYQKIIIKEI